MIEVKTFTGADATPYFGDLARLRIEVFRAFPYLYDGDADYERRYLATYANAPDSVFVLAFDDGRAVGASTGMPLAQEVEALQLPWIPAGIDPESVFYFGESVLLPAYRGQGIGHRFFDEREAFARRLGGSTWTSFCAVDRDDDHPQRPPDYRPLHAFWRARGYQPHGDLACRMAWKEVGSDTETDHRLSVWSRPIGRD